MRIEPKLEESAVLHPQFIRLKKKSFKSQMFLNVLEQVVEDQSSSSSSPSPSPSSSSSRSRPIKRVSTARQADYPPWLDFVDKATEFPIFCNSIFLFIQAFSVFKLFNPQNESCDSFLEVKVKNYDRTDAVEQRGALYTPEPVTSSYNDVNQSLPYLSGWRDLLWIKSTGKEKRRPRAEDKKEKEERDKHQIKYQQTPKNTRKEG